MVKNKVSPPFKLAEFDILFGQGVNVIGDLLDQGVIHNLISKSGAWYSFGDEKIGQGRERASEWLTERPDIVKQLRASMAPADTPFGKCSRATEAA